MKTFTITFPYPVRQVNPTMVEMVVDTQPGRIIDEDFGCLALRLLGTQHGTAFIEEQEEVLQAALLHETIEVGTRVIPPKNTDQKVY